MVRATGRSQAVHMVAGQSGWILGRRAEPPRAWNRFQRWHRRSLEREADYLDGVVDAQLEFIRTLPMYQRDRLAAALAVLVILAQDHRRCAQGWINRRELRHRAEHALGGLDALLEVGGTAAAAPRMD
jgi:hypothetical protein